MTLNSHPAGVNANKVVSYPVRYPVIISTTAGRYLVSPYGEYQEHQKDCCKP